METCEHMAAHPPHLLLPSLEAPLGAQPHKICLSPFQCYSLTRLNGIYTQAKSFKPPRLFLSSSTSCQLMVNLQEFSSWQTGSPSTFSFTSWLKKNQEGQLVSREILSVPGGTSAHFADARPVQEQLQPQLWHRAEEGPGSLRGQNHGIAECFGLERALKTISFHTCHGQGHPSLAQAACPLHSISNSQMNFQQHPIKQYIHDSLVKCFF